MTLPYALDAIDLALDALDEARRKRRTATAAKAKPEPTLAQMEQRMAKEVARLWLRQGRAVVRALRTQRTLFSEADQGDGDAIDKLLDDAMQDSSVDMLDVLERYMKAAMLNGGRKIISDFNARVVFSLQNPRAVAYTRTHAADMITAIDDTTRADLKRIIVTAITNGESYTAVARQIAAKYTQYTAPAPQRHIRNRAELVAITEIGNGYAAGAEVGAYMLAKAGVKLEKQWLTVGDRRVSAGCRTNAAAGWIPLDQDFPSGHSRPLRFPGCRCTAQYRPVVG